MGAWSYGVFDDDTAYDALHDLKNSDSIVIDMEKYFEDILSGDKIEYDEGVYGLVSAAVIDSAVNKTQYRCDEEDYFTWTQTLDDVNFGHLFVKAIEAVNAVIGEKSELQELWSENEELYDSWVEDKIAIVERLKLSDDEPDDQQ